MFKKIILLIAIFSFSFEVIANEDQAKIKQIYSEYNKAILNCDGNKVVALLSSQTIQYYSDIAQQILNGKNHQDVTGGLIDKLQFATVQGYVNPAVLAKLDGKEIIKVIIYKQLIEGTNAEDSLNDLVITNNTAQASMVIDGIDINIPVEFVKENNAWLYNLLPSLYGAEKLLFDQIEQAGISINDLMEMFLADASNEAVTQNACVGV